MVIIFSATMRVRGQVVGLGPVSLSLDHQASINRSNCVHERIWTCASYREQYTPHGHL